jgi:hypothetical protein
MERCRTAAIPLYHVDGVEVGAFCTGTREARRD